jgi:hypothetical protein
MKKYIILVLAIFYFGCAGQQQSTGNSRYTKEQVAALHLDSTTILNAVTDSVTKINLNPFLKEQDFDFGSLVEEVKLVLLETTDESLLDDIYKVLVTDSHIYIHDSYKRGGIVVFDRNGKFIRRIPNGGGPGELSRLYDIAFDPESNELVVYQHSFLLFFTAEGQYIRKMRSPFAFYNFTVIPNGYVFKKNSSQENIHLELLNDYELYITDKNFKLQSVSLLAYPEGDVLVGHHYLYNNNNTIKVTQGYNDTIYQYIQETNCFKAVYILDYSKKKISELYLKGSYNDFKNAILQNDYYFYIGEYFETESHHAFKLNNWHINSEPIIFRDKKTGNMTGGTGRIYDPNEIPPSVGFPIATSGDYFISTYYPHDQDSLIFNSSIVSKEDKEKIKNLKEDDNQILVFFKLKNF